MPEPRQNPSGAKAEQPQQPAPLMGFRPGGPWGMLPRRRKIPRRHATLLRLWGYIRRQSLGCWSSPAFSVIATSAARPARPLPDGHRHRRLHHHRRPARAGAPAGLDGRHLRPGAGRLPGCRPIIMAGVAQHAVRDMRNDLFAHLQTLPLRFFDQTHPRRPDEPPDQRRGEHQQHPGDQLQPA